MSYPSQGFWGGFLFVFPRSCMSYGRLLLSLASQEELQEIGCSSKVKCIQDAAASSSVLIHVHLTSASGYLCFRALPSGDTPFMKHKANDGQRAFGNPAVPANPSMMPWQWVLKNLAVAWSRMLGAVARRLCLLDRTVFSG